jgi:hypothetical protein
MSEALGPLDGGRVPPAQQTRVGAFLISLHGALARRLALGLPATLRYGWQTEWHSQLYRETEIATLMMRATSWVLDFELPALWLGWEMAWLPRPVEGITDVSQGPWIDLAALAHAGHSAIRPAALLPVEADAQDAFVLALRRIEFESSRLIQAQIVLLKGPDLLPVRDAVIAAVEQRHRQVREIWEAMLAGIGVQRETGE